MQETQEMWVRTLRQEDPLEKEMATHSGILAWRIPWTEEPGRLKSMELQRVGHDLVTKRHIDSFVLVSCGGGVQSLSCVRLFATPWTAACQASLSFTISWSLLRLMSTESVMPSNCLILCCSLLLLLSNIPLCMYNTSF